MAFCQAITPVIGLAGQILGGIKKLDAEHDLADQVTDLQTTAEKLQEQLSQLQQSAQKLANEFARWADILPPLFAAEMSLDPLLAHVTGPSDNMMEKVKVALALWGNLQHSVEAVFAIDPLPINEAARPRLQAQLALLQDTSGQVEKSIRLGAWTETASLIGNLRGFIGAIQSLARQAFNPQI